MATGGKTDRVEIALIGAQQPAVLSAMKQRYTVHEVHAEPDLFAALARLGAGCRAAAGHGMAGLTRRHIELMPKLEICTINGVGLETSDLAASGRLMTAELGVGYLTSHFADPAAKPVGNFTTRAKIQYFPTELVTVTLTGDDCPAFGRLAHIRAQWRA